MPTVWVRQDPKHRTRFHRHPDCPQLRKKQARGDGYPLVAADLNDVHVRPCMTCYPDAPRTKVRHPYCHICASHYACEHNGGILVVARAGRHIYVWPDANQMPLYRRSA